MVVGLGASAVAWYRGWLSYWGMGAWGPWVVRLYWASAVVSLCLQIAAHRRSFPMPARKAPVHIVVSALLLIAVTAGLGGLLWTLTG